MSTTLTTLEYAKIKKCTPQAIRKAILNNKLHLLPKIVSIKKHGRDWLIEMAI